MKRSQLLVGRSSLYCKDMWRRYCCLTSSFQIADTCLSCEDIARRSCAMVPRWRFLATFLRPVFATIREQQVSDLHICVVLLRKKNNKIRQSALLTAAVRRVCLIDFQQSRHDVQLEIFKVFRVSLDINERSVQPCSMPVARTRQ